MRVFHRSRRNDVKARHLLLVPIFLSMIKTVKYMTSFADFGDKIRSWWEKRYSYLLFKTWYRTARTHQKTCLLCSEIWNLFLIYIKCVFSWTLAEINDNEVVTIKIILDVSLACVTHLTLSLAICMQLWAFPGQQ